MLCRLEPPPHNPLEKAGHGLQRRADAASGARLLKQELRRRILAWHLRLAFSFSLHPPANTLPHTFSDFSNALLLRRLLLYPVHYPPVESISTSLSSLCLVAPQQRASSAPQHFPFLVNRTAILWTQLLQLVRGQHPLVNQADTFSARVFTSHWVTDFTELHDLYHHISRCAPHLNTGTLPQSPSRKLPRKHLSHFRHRICYWRLLFRCVKVCKK